MSRLTDEGRRALGGEIAGASPEFPATVHTAEEAVDLVRRLLRKAATDSLYRYDPRVNICGEVLTDDLAIWAAASGVPDALFRRAIGAMLQCGCLRAFSCKGFPLKYLVGLATLSAGTCECPRHITVIDTVLATDGHYDAHEVDGFLKRYLGQLERRCQERAARVPTLLRRNTAVDAMMHRRWPEFGAPLEELEDVMDRAFPGARSSHPRGIRLETRGRKGADAGRLVDGYWDGDAAVPDVVYHQIAPFGTTNLNRMLERFGCKPFPRGDLGQSLIGLMTSGAIRISSLPSDSTTRWKRGWYSPVFRFGAPEVAASKSTGTSAKPSLASGSGELISTSSARQDVFSAAEKTQRLRKRGRPRKTAPGKVDLVVAEIVKRGEHKTDDPKRWKTLRQKYAEKLPRELTHEALRKRVERWEKTHHPDADVPVKPN